jgi:phosphotransferase system enzyme I (PtsI)
MKGLVTERGGRTSHTAILAKALGIPAIVGVEFATDRISTGDRLILDAHSGVVIVTPTPKEMAEFQTKFYASADVLPEQESEARGPLSTRDGVRIQVAANIEYDQELDILPNKGIDGVGLYRSEHLYFNRSSMPSEEDHYHHYRRLAESAYPEFAVVRTLDMGGDRPPPAVSNLLMDEPNPALGVRATRFSLRHKDLFKQQLRGILRASVHGKLKIMYPMVSGLDEIHSIRAVLSEAKEELLKEGQPFVEVEEGVLIETPAAAICADILAREMDFIGVGSNDLTQYTLAVDRTNKEVAELFEPFHPAMLRIYRNLVQAASAAGVPITVCGELASEPESALILIGLGFRSLSMTMSRIAEVKSAVQEKNIRELESFALKLMECETGDEVKTRLRSIQSRLRPKNTNLRSSA